MTKDPTIREILESVYERGGYDVVPYGIGNYLSIDQAEQEIKSIMKDKMETLYRRVKYEEQQEILKKIPSEEELTEFIFESSLCHTSMANRGECATEVKELAKIIHNLLTGKLQ